ncbi:MAG: haloacid dehalogenase type II [Rhodobacter sp.]|nr:haloacid dehalogenase type II [Rhodobacter sp.]
MTVRALLFDVFGTVVDWRSSVADELRGFFVPRGVTRDWVQLALDWRAMYQPAMEEIRSQGRGFVTLDTLHRENLVKLLRANDLTDLSAPEIDHLNHAWHRLRPWPDCVAGLTRLRARHVLATLSNGNVALMVDLARFGGLPWDAILGAEFTRSYKPDPHAYLGTAAALALPPADCMMVAAHNDDLHAAQDLGFATAFVCRPGEYGPGQRVDLEPDGDWDVVTDSMTGLADTLAP